MKRLIAFVSTMLLWMTLGGLASAAPAVFTIGGHSTSGDIGNPAGGERTVGLNVRQAADGSLSGSVSVKVTAANGAAYSSVRGEIICIRQAIEAPGGDGWEVRYRITRAGSGAALPPGSYESLFVRDDPAGDQTAQVANTLPEVIADPSCGRADLVPNVVWDDVIKGDIRIKG